MKAKYLSIMRRMEKAFNDIYVNLVVFLFDHAPGQSTM